MCYTGSADDLRMASLFSFSDTLDSLGFKEMRYIVARSPINLHSCLSPLCHASLFNALSNCKTTSAACYCRHELEKRRMCVWEEDQWSWVWLLHTYCTLLQRWLGPFCNSGVQATSQSSFYAAWPAHSRTLTFVSTCYPSLPILLALMYGFVRQQYIYSEDSDDCSTRARQ